MKTTITINIDTERENPLVITKPEIFNGTINMPTTPEEAKDMILTDIGCVCEALWYLIDISDKSGYAFKKELIETAIKTLNDKLVETPKP